MIYFSGNTPAIIRKQTTTDLYGQPILTAPLAVMVNVIKFTDNTKPTALRTEMSASHGRIDDETVDSVLLFPPGCNIEVDDIVTVLSTDLVVAGVWPKNTTYGAPRHIRVTLHKKAV